MDSWPEAMLTMRDGTKNGETRLGPRSRMTRCHSRMVRMPPMPEPTSAPARVASTWEKSILASSTASTPATIAYWMKRSSFFSSFFSITLRGSKLLTSAAIRASRRLGSNRVMGPTPDWPSQMARQYSGTEFPRGVTAPNPVTTTRGLPPSAPITSPPPPMVPRKPGGGLGVFLDVLDRVTHRGDLLRVLVRDLDVELLLERHHELHRVQGVGAEILDELRGRNDVVLLDTELLDDDCLDTLLDRLVARSHLRPSPPHMYSPPLPWITWPVM